MSFEDLLDLVPATLHERSGAVLYSGRAAFSGQKDVYLLGLNPGGSPQLQTKETIKSHVKAALERTRSNWSEYRDESWAGKPPGRHGMQPRILHFCKRLHIDPGLLPASNVVFVRSGREQGLLDEKQSLLTACWPLHDAVIRQLGVRVVVALGGTCGQWVREMTGAHQAVDSFRENNARGWGSDLHSAPSGLMVATLTHPSIAAWNVEATDPTVLVERALARPNGSLLPPKIRNDLLM